MRIEAYFEAPRATIDACLWVVIAAAMMTWESTWTDISQWVQVHAALLVEVIKPAPKRVRSLATLRRALSWVDVAALEAAQRCRRTIPALAFRDSSLH